MARSDLVRAEALIREGLRELPGESEFTLDRVSCLLNGSEVAREGGVSQNAIARSLAAQDLLKSSPLRSDVRICGQNGVGGSYRAAGQYRDAIPAFERASVLMISLGRDDTETAGTLFNNWALALHLSGRPLEAEALFRRAIAISRADVSDQGISPMLLINYARNLNELGRSDEAAEYAERGYGESLAGWRPGSNKSIAVVACPNLSPAG